MLLDTASLYFRAFYGVPEIKAPNGTPVNAVRGLLDFMSRLVGEYQPDHLVCCWDNDWRPQWRVDLLPTYKSHRVEYVQPGDKPDVEDVPDPLEIQVPVIEAVLKAYGIAKVGADGYEADDVIGTLATGAAPTGRRRHRRPRPVPARRRRRRRPGPLHRPRRRPARAGDQRLGPRQVRHRRPPVRRLRDPARRRLRRAARRGRASATRPPPLLLQRFGDIPGIVAAAQDPDADMGPGPRGKIKAALDYLAVAPTGGGRRPRHRPRHARHHPPRPPPPTRTCWPRSSEEFGLTSSVDRLTETLAADRG